MRKPIEQRIKEHKMAKQYFEEEEDKGVSFVTLFFAMLIAFSLGIKIAGYHAEKHLKEIVLPKCNCTIKDIEHPPKSLPNHAAQAIEDIAQLEVFVNGKS